jgi:ADP-ribosylglycohydrolase
MIRIDVYHHIQPFDAGAAARIESLLHQIIAQGKAHMTAITDALDGLNTKVAALETVEASAITLLQGLKSALDAALALGDPAAIVAAVQTVSDKIGADTDTLAAAVAAGTTAAP